MDVTRCALRGRECAQSRDEERAEGRMQIECTSARILDVYYNRSVSKRDHVVTYLAEKLDSSRGARTPQIRNRGDWLVHTTRCFATEYYSLQQVCTPNIFNHRHSGGGIVRGVNAIQQKHPSNEQMFRNIFKFFSVQYFSSNLVKSGERDEDLIDAFHFRLNHQKRAKLELGDVMLSIKRNNLFG